MKEVKEVSTLRWLFLIAVMLYAWIFSEFSFADSLLSGAGLYYFFRSLDYREADEYTGAIYFLMLVGFIIFAVRFS